MPDDNICHDGAPCQHGCIDDCRRLAARLDPGIRELVTQLRRRGFNTTDSGDGSKSPQMEGALPYPHVVILLAEKVDMVAEADRCADLMLELGYEVDPISGWSVTASYNPADGQRLIVIEGPRPVGGVAAILDG
jgi:hypothetical protein